MELYANGIKYDSTRELDGIEAKILKSKLHNERKLYKWHYRSGLLVFYLCILSVLIERTYTLFLNGNIEHSGFFIFVFCCVFPPLIGILQEIIFPFKLWSRLLFVLICLFFITTQLFDSLVNSDVVISSVVLITLLFAWVMILLRWFDAKKYSPILTEGLKDLENAKVDRFIELDDEGNELINLETLPKSHLIYRIDDENYPKWEVAEVVEISNTKPDEYLAPWYYAPTDALENGLKYFQRKITQDEASELAGISRRIKRKTFVSILPSIYLSALGVRFVENILNKNIEPELSNTGWIIAVSIGLIFPIRWLNKWLKLRKDIKAQQVVSIWGQYEDETKDILLEEVLPESGLLWSQNNRPSYWRVRKSL